MCPLNHLYLPHTPGVRFLNVLLTNAHSILKLSRQPRKTEGESYFSSASTDKELRARNLGHRILPSALLGVKPLRRERLAQCGSHRHVLRRRGLIAITARCTSEHHTLRPPLPTLLPEGLLQASCHPSLAQSPSPLAGPFSGLHLAGPSPHLLPSPAFIYPTFLFQEASLARL